MTCQRSLRNLVPGLEIVQNSMLLRPYCVLDIGHHDLGTEKMLRLGSLAVPTTARPVATLPGCAIVLLASSWVLSLGPEA